MVEAELAEGLVSGLDCTTDAAKLGGKSRPLKVSHGRAAPELLHPDRPEIHSAVQPDGNGAFTGLDQAQALLTQPGSRVCMHQAHIVWLSQSS